MARGVKSEMPEKKRTYVSAKRDQQATATRWAIIEAAQRLFVANGFSATSVQAIADEAGVAVQTVYAVFRSKRELLMQLIEVAITGDDEPDAITERPESVALRSERDPHRRAAMAAKVSRAIVERVGPIVRVASEAAASDPDFAPLYDAMRAVRRDEMTASAKLVGGSDLRVSAQNAAATLYVLYSPQVADMLVGDYGWSFDRYEKWLADAIERLLLSQG